jgi:hypothetical protein
MMDVYKENLNTLGDELHSASTNSKDLREKIEELIENVKNHDLNMVRIQEC